MSKSDWFFAGCLIGASIASITNVFMWSIK